MEDCLKDIIEYLLPLRNIYLYIFLFISAIIENLFPPIPGDTITAFGAFLVGTGRLSYLYVYISTTVGSVFGFMFLVFVGRSLERKFFHEKDYKYFSAEKIAEAEGWVQKYGYFIVLANRFLPGIRSVISIVSGISMLKIPWVFLWALVSASIWNLIWIQVGYVVGNNWETVQKEVGGILRQYNIAVCIFLVLAIAVIIIIKRRNKKRIENDNTLST